MVTAAEEKTTMKIAFIGTGQVGALLAARLAEAGHEAHVAQIADEKQTIVNMVSAGLGVAIVPRWTSRMATRGVRFIRLAASDMNRLPLAAASVRGTRDPVRDDVLEMLRADLARYAREA